MAGPKSIPLGAEITDSKLYVEALTHRSAGTPHNERLEFLGDSVLGMIVSEWIFGRLPEASEGELSRMRAALVKKETLAEIAKEYGLGDRLRLGGGELKSGGYRRDSILGDAVEALIGAVFCLQGIEAARDFVCAIYGERLTTLPPLSTLKDPKSRLQELLQGRNLPLPEYSVVELSGDPHRQQFTVACAVAPLSIQTTGVASSRRKAEQQAAQRALEQIQQGQ
jgi:ribonuclease-3